MRFAGRIEPGSGVGPRTGHAGLLIPARIALTREMLSALVRLFGCVATASRIAESGAVLFPAPPRARLRPVSAAATCAGMAATGAGATAPADESLVGAEPGERGVARLSSPHAATTSRLDDSKSRRRGIGIAP